MRYLMAIVAILLLCAGSTMFFYWDDLSALWLPLLVVFLRRAIWRVVYRFFWFMLLLPIMPERARHAYFKLVGAMKHAAVVYSADVVAMWKWAPWWLRVLMALVGAMLSGLAALVLLVIPVHVGKIPFIGVWLKEVGTPALMRSAAARGIELNVPPAWKSAPAHIREFFRKPYMRLWWWTARRLVRTRQAVGRRTLRRLKRKAHSKK